MAQNEVLLRDLDADDILRLTLNDPGWRSARCEGMLVALGGVFAEAGANPAVRLVILAANGPAFCAGHEVRELSAGQTGRDEWRPYLERRAYFEHIMAQRSGVMQGIVNCPKPAMAEFAGVGTAAGAHLAPNCDLAVAAGIAFVSTPGVHIGLFYSTSMVDLSRNVSAKHAM